MNDVWMVSCASAFAKRRLESHGKLCINSSEGFIVDPDT